MNPPREAALEQAVRAAVRDLVEDISDRRGLKREWQAIDEDVREEIIQTWRTMIEARVRPLLDAPVSCSEAHPGQDVFHPGGHTREGAPLGVGPITVEDIMAIQRQYGLLDDGWNREVAEAIVTLMARRSVASFPVASPSEVAALLHMRRKALEAEDRWARVQTLVVAAELAVLFLSGHTHGEGMAIHDRLGVAVDAVKGMT